MPAILTASPHKAMSAAIIAANASGVLPSGSTPNAASRSANFASLAAWATSFAIRSTVSVGIADGAISPFQVSALKPGNPDSANVRELRDALLARHRKQANGSAVCLRHGL